MMDKDKNTDPEACDSHQLRGVLQHHLHQMKQDIKEVEGRMVKNTRHNLDTLIENKDKLHATLVGLADEIKHTNEMSIELYEKIMRRYLVESKKMRKRNEEIFCDFFQNVMENINADDWKCAADYMEAMKDSEHPEYWLNVLRDAKYQLQDLEKNKRVWKVKTVVQPDRGQYVYGTKPLYFGLPDEWGESEGDEDAGRGDFSD